jgi:thioesterase domain-containing protein
MERQLAALWKPLLGVRAFGVHDSFFDLGGHSRLAIELAHAIEREFGRALPVHVLFRAQTIAEQAAVLRAEGSVMPWRALDPIKTHGERLPLFFVGSTGFARALAPFLPANLPMYGLKVLGLDGQDGSELDVEVIAATFIEEVVKVQAHGPYALAAFCDDCKVAQSMAQQLQDRGRPVASLVFIDPIWSELLDVWSDNFWRNLARHRGDWVVELIRMRSLKAWRKVLRWNRNRSATRVIQRDIDFISAYQNACASFRPQPHQGDLTILLSDEFYSDRAQHGLRPLATGNVRVRPIPGFHRELFTGKRIAALARGLLHSLTEDDDSASFSGSRSTAARQR